MGIGQPRPRIGQKLRYGRAIHPDGAGERALAETAVAERAVEAQAKLLGAQAFVHNINHVMNFITIAEFC